MNDSFDEVEHFRPEVFLKHLVSFVEFTPETTGSVELEVATRLDRHIVISKQIVTSPHLI